MEDPGLRDEFFDVVGIGGLRLGIGSALDRKYLVRVQGDTDDPMDDEVLEIKEVRSLAGISCIEATEDDPFRVLLSQARIAYRPFNHLGYLRLDGRNFWVHAWVQNYDEVEIGESFRTPEELAEVAYDAGVQLGRGHHKMIAAPFDTQLKQAQLEFLDTHSDEVAAASRELAELRIEVQDTGEDIPADQLEHIFDKYYQPRSHARALGHPRHASLQSTEWLRE